MSRQGLYFRHRSSYEHDTGPHPENAGRIRAIEETLSAADWLGMELAEPAPTTRERLARVHDPRLVTAIEELCAAGGGMIDMDTCASEGSWDAALRAAGAAIEATERLLAGEARFAFCGMRPPGHHAERSRSMGFCLFNNVAVAAAHAVEVLGTSSVLILDWDVHHGNGTADIFEDSDRVLYASIHQDPLYPGTGHAREVGSGAGEGYTINMPVPAGSGPDEFLSLVQEVVVPVGRSLEPGLLAISAGFDAHRDDPLANCLLDEDAYADMAASIRDLGEEIGAPVLVCLEGGYHPGALADSVTATLTALGGDAPPRTAPPEAASAYVANARRYWPI